MSKLKCKLKWGSALALASLLFIPRVPVSAAETAEAVLSITVNVISGGVEVTSTSSVDFGSVPIGTSPEERPILLTVNDRSGGSGWVATLREANTEGGGVSLLVKSDDKDSEVSTPTQLTNKALTIYNATSGEGTSSTKVGAISLSQPDDVTPLALNRTLEWTVTAKV